MKNLQDYRSEYKKLKIIKRRIGVPVFIELI